MIKQKPTQIQIQSVGFLSSIRHLFSIGKSSSLTEQQDQYEPDQDLVGEGPICNVDEKKQSNSCIFVSDVDFCNNSEVSLDSYASGSNKAVKSFGFFKSNRKVIPHDPIQIENREQMESIFCKSGTEKIDKLISILPDNMTENNLLDLLNNHQDGVARLELLFVHLDRLTELVVSQQFTIKYLLNSEISYLKCLLQMDLHTPRPT